MKNLNENRPSALALLPFAVFILIYMGAGIYYQVKGVEAGGRYHVQGPHQ